MTSFKRTAIALLSLLLLAGTAVLLFLLILAGAFDKRPLNEIFWLQADTTGIPNSPRGLCHWTLYNFCDAQNGRNVNCRPNNAAYPFLPQRNFQTSRNIPEDFMNNPRIYFYLSRFLYSFYIVDVFFTSCALLTGVVALFSKIGDVVSALFSVVALFFTAFSASIMTACFVMGQKAFRREGKFARVGMKAFAFTWTCVVLLFLAALGFCFSCLSRRRMERYEWVRGSRGRGMSNRMFRKDYSSKSIADGSRGHYISDNESQPGMNKEHGHNDPRQTV